MLSIRELTAGYGKLEILHQLSVDIQVNHMTTILGANGSGKSTLLKSIFGLTTITGGSITYNDREIIGISTENISKLGIAYVPQRENIFASMTVRENLALAVRKASRAEAALRIDRAFDLFPILTKRANQRTGLMSGGERQMVAIAMGWLMNPSLMLLDEPTAGLAPLVAKEVFETLYNLSQKGITLVIVEQNARTALRWCEDVCILREGTLVYQGRNDAFAEDDSLLHTYLGLLSIGKQ
ncbi:MAG: ABC transporter ATP-binding protein [Anaerolineae bacterium]|nr:ABC transporter ATP-binding protein [Anaerolineae bacterium]MDQ7035701.1 ABC transporter ATP-binding protein [Anaerolineae bacterium]